MGRAWSGSIVLPQEIHQLASEQDHFPKHCSGERIMVCIDSSGNHRGALDLVRKTVRSGDQVVLFCALPVIWHRKQAFSVTEIDQIDLEAMNSCRRSMKIVLEQMGTSLLHLGTDVTLHICHGNAREAILHAAEYHKVNCIVLGPRHVSDVTKWFGACMRKLHIPAFQWSVSAFVTAHAQQDVLLAKQ